VDIEQTRLRADEASRIRVALDNVTSSVMMAAGDLTQPLKGAYRGSFDNLKQNVNSTLSDLREILGQLHESIGEMRTTADEISSGNTNLSFRTEQQASNLQETASSIEELTSTVRNNADNAQQANHLAANARGKAEQGGEVVSRAVQAMQSINAASAEQSAGIDQVNQAVTSMDEITQQNAALAEQTSAASPLP
jgi:methyl-accepting chemotaxis protein